MWQFDAASGKGSTPTTAASTAYPCEAGEDGMIRVDVG